MFTLDGHWIGREQGLKSETQNKIVARNDQIIKLSAKFKSVAYFPFIYQSQDDMLGTSEMPIVKDYFKKLSSSILAGNFNPKTWVGATPSPPAECKILEPTCEGKDWVRRDSCGKELGRW